MGETHSVPGEAARCLGLNDKLCEVHKKGILKGSYNKERI